MKITILIPCYNEGLTIEKCLLSCINQTRRADEIIVVDDCSTDNTPLILRRFQAENLIKAVRTSKNTGNKSYAQEYGLHFISGDVFVTTDGDTMLKNDFLEFVEKDMANNSISAVAGYIKSLEYNWITGARAIDYAVSQNIDKLAQDYINFVYVIPGAAGAFRTDIFKSTVSFSHDTLAEDLDFTYTFHKLNYKIIFDRRAVCFTQDPATLASYISQMRRWFGGGWQCFAKHFGVPVKPGMAMELSFIYIEGLIYSSLMFVLPLISLYLSLYLFLIYCLIGFFLVIFAAFKEKRADLIKYFFGYMFLKYVNAWIFIEQFFHEIVLRKKNLVWVKPKRIKI